MDPESQKLYFFALAEPECITVSNPVPDLDPNPTYNGKIKNQHSETKFLGNYAASDIKKRQDFVQFVLKNCAKYCLNPEQETEFELR